MGSFTTKDTKGAKGEDGGRATADGRGTGDGGRGEEGRCYLVRW